MEPEISKDTGNLALYSPSFQCVSLFIFVLLLQHKQGIYFQQTAWRPYWFLPPSRQHWWTCQIHPSSRILLSEKAEDALNREHDLLSGLEAELLSVGSRKTCTDLSCRSWHSAQRVRWNRKRSFSLRSFLTTPGLKLLRVGNHFSHSIDSKKAILEG